MFDRENIGWWAFIIGLFLVLTLISSPESYGVWYNKLIGGFTQPAKYETPK